MWTTALILEIICAASLVGLLLIDYRYSRAVFSVLFVVGVMALSVPVNIMRIDEYWAGRRAVEAAATTTVPELPPPFGWGQTPRTTLPAMLPPEIRPPSGAAAPPVVRNPYFPLR